MVPRTSPDYTEDEVHVGNTYYIRTDLHLAEYPWTWCTQRVQLQREDTSQRVAGQPMPRYRYRYNLPQGIGPGKVRAVFHTQQAREEQAIKYGWEPVSAGIETDLDDVYVDYTRYVTEEVWPAEFVYAMMANLKHEWAFYFTDQQNKEDAALLGAQASLLMAKNIDARTKPAEGFQDFPLLQARYQGRAGRGDLLLRVGSG